ncbi:MAG TPA: hypothetical protein VHN73_05210 [Phenylobacterium sp.]|nr:hypothetical protein [Phenylobacterium sp.]
MKTPNHRQRSGRRLVLLVCAMLAVAITTGVIGFLAGPSSAPHAKAATGPFSYFPFQ